MGIEPTVPPLSRSTIGFEDRDQHQSGTRFHWRTYTETGQVAMQGRQSRAVTAGRDRRFDHALACVLWSAARAMTPLTDAEIFDEVIVTCRRAFPALPEIQVIERPGWLQIITPSITTGGLNEVIHAALAAHEADAIIDDTIAHYRALGLKFRWNAGPGSAPADLGARLARRGLEVSWGRGMARATTARVEGVDPAIHVAEVDATTVDVFSRVMAAGWSADPAPLADVNRRILGLPGSAQHLFVAFVDGQPAATAGYVAFPRSAYLIGGVVLPAYRGRGLYRALVQARLAHAAARRIGLATSHAREETAAPILERLGFATVARFPLYFG